MLYEENERKLEKQNGGKMKTDKERFDECVRKAIKLGRSWMVNKDLKDDAVSKEEWQLACMLYIAQ